MSRVVNAKIRITGELVADVPVSVGGAAGGDPSSNVDIDLARDGRGRYYIPGSGLAGPMRAWVELNLQVGGKGGKYIANSLFGDEDSGDETSGASPFFVDDAVLKNSAAGKERRHGIKINEQTGTVEGKSFYTRAILPKGSSFPVHMELELSGDEEKNKIKINALRLLLEAMRDGRVRFGACKTRGFGAMRLENLKVDYYDFTGPLGSGVLRRWLEGCEAESRGLATLLMNAGVVCREAQKYRIEIAWSPKSKIMVKSGSSGLETDMMPFVSAVPNGGSVPVIPGSSLKGALRSQACKIMRTLCGDSTDGNMSFFAERLVALRSN